ncbi:hypothetical protein [Speluncibacter jeojiensis]|uniref:hypothetical protein n=1 Tax=Speluncibacter jeojiensis TaxID=2710754 RepID=UPI00240F6524|nr:hypothetical protein [Rhodococcus sp. D2-41]
MTAARPEPTAPQPSEAAADVLFSEPGARRRGLWFGPLFGLAGFLIDLIIGGGVHVVVWLAAALIILVFTPLPIRAARMHASVELTRATLRQGTETTPLHQIVRIFDAPPDDRANDDPREPWESARALGELPGVPRRRTGIGLQLRNGTLVQAWAKDDELLRTSLTEALVAWYRAHPRRRPQQGAAGGRDDAGETGRNDDHG